MNTLSDGACHCPVSRRQHPQKTHHVTRAARVVCFLGGFRCLWWPVRASSTPTFILTSPCIMARVRCFGRAVVGLRECVRACVRARACMFCARQCANDGLVPVDRAWRPARTASRAHDHMRAHTLARTHATPPPRSGLASSPSSSPGGPRSGSRSTTPRRTPCCTTCARSSTSRRSGSPTCPTRCCGAQERGARDVCEHDTRVACARRLL